jgi:multidrug transporter EmrE-like cation transporter
MLQRIRLYAMPYAQGNASVIGGLILLNLVFNILANAGFKFSAMAVNWKGFLAWQVAGNLAGLITVLTLTGLLRYLPLSVVNPLTMGLTIVGVQVVTARFIFHEAITPTQWLGTLLIVIGIFFIQRP